MRAQNDQTILVPMSIDFRASISVGINRVGSSAYSLVSALQHPLNLRGMPFSAARRSNTACIKCLSDLAERGQACCLNLFDYRDRILHELG